MNRYATLKTLLTLLFTLYSILGYTGVDSVLFKESYPEERKEDFTTTLNQPIQPAVAVIYPNLPHPPELQAHMHTTPFCKACFNPFFHTLLSLSVIQDILFAKDPPTSTYLIEHAQEIEDLRVQIEKITQLHEHHAWPYHMFYLERKDDYQHNTFFFAKDGILIARMPGQKILLETQRNIQTLLKVAKKISTAFHDTDPSNTAIESLYEQFIEQRELISYEAFFTLPLNSATLFDRYNMSRFLHAEPLLRALIAFTPYLTMDASFFKQVFERPSGRYLLLKIIEATHPDLESHTPIYLGGINEADDQEPHLILKGRKALMNKLYFQLKNALYHWKNRLNEHHWEHIHERHMTILATQFNKFNRTILNYHDT